MKRIIYHLLTPAFMTVLFFMIAATPAQVLGCRNRGLLALLTTLVSGLAALGAAFWAAKLRKQGRVNSGWWAISSLILILPVLGLIILA